jgi:hypothetical protein
MCTCKKYSVENFYIYAQNTTAVSIPTYQHERIVSKQTQKLPNDRKYSIPWPKNRNETSTFYLGPEIKPVSNIKNNRAQNETTVFSVADTNPLLIACIRELFRPP